MLRLPENKQHQSYKSIISSEVKIPDATPSHIHNAIIAQFIAFVKVNYVHLRSHLEGTI